MRKRGREGEREQQPRTAFFLSSLALCSSGCSLCRRERGKEIDRENEEREGGREEARKEEGRKAEGDLTCCKVE